MAKKILIVEDDHLLRKILIEKLKEEDFELIDAPDGEAGLAAAIEHKPDLILLDIIMPKMDGFTMTDKLREYEKSQGVVANNQIPIIYLTNLGEEKGMAPGQMRGIYDYLVKSDWDLDGLVKKVKDKLNI